MSSRFEITDERWIRIEHLLPGRANSPGVTAADNRKFVAAVLWIARTGAPWRALPEHFGNWNSTFQRFNRWAKSGIWAKVMDALDGDADLEHLLIDSTIIRAHQHSAGAKKKAETKLLDARVEE